MIDKSDTEMLWRTIRHILARGRKLGNIRPGLEAMALELEDLFTDLAAEESLGVDSRAILREILDELDEEDSEEP